MQNNSQRKRLAYSTLSDSFRLAALGKRPAALRQLNTHLMEIDLSVQTAQGIRLKKLMEMKTKLEIGKKLL